MRKLLGSSWRTTASGIIGVLVIWMVQAQALLDNDIATNPDWFAAVSMTAIAFGLVKARDNKVTSEAAHIK